MFEHIANWSSILGFAVGLPALLYSILAFREAKRAKQASERAEVRVEQVRGDLRHLAEAEELSHLSSRAAELLVFVDLEQYETAVYVSRELRFELNRAITKWETDDGEVKGRLTKSSNNLKKVTEFLRAHKELSPEQKATLAAQCDETANALRAETGRLQALLERR